MSRQRAVAETVPEPPAEGAPSVPLSSKGARTRERLVEAAKEIFEEHGFLEARITDIAERAGQSHGSFYYYFVSKKEIFREVAASVDEGLFAPLGDVIFAQSALPPLERIREAMRRYLERYRRDARIMTLIDHVARIDTEVNELRLARHRRYTERAAESLRFLQRRKLADPGLDPLLTAAAFGALTQRFAEMWLVHGAVDSTLPEVVDQLTRIYTNAIRLTI
jgi:AcrR family transcriptional regulator